MRVVLEAKTATRCRSCSYLNPLPGLRHRAVCSSCSQPIDVAGKIREGIEVGLRYSFGGYYDAVAESFLYDEDHELKDARNSHGSPFALRKVARFSCHCGAPLGDPQNGATDVRCAKCNDRTPVRWPDDLTREWDPRIAYVVGDAGDRGVALAQKLEGTVVPCGGCGAPLAQQGRQRVIACTHCHAENFLSDAIWTKLFPRPEEHAFFIVYERDEDAQAEAIAFLQSTTKYFFEDADKKRIAALARPMKDRVFVVRVKRAIANEEDAIDDVEIARAIVSRGDLDAAKMESIDGRMPRSMRSAVVKDASDAFIARWLASEDVATRAIAASVAKGAALDACASDAAYEVRAVVAMRTDAPAEILGALRKDPESSVREKARANPSHPVGFFTKLFGG